MVTVKQQWWLVAAVVIALGALLIAFIGLDTSLGAILTWAGAALTGACVCMSIRPGMGERYAQSLTEQLAAQQSMFERQPVLRPPPPMPLPVVNEPAPVRLWCEQNGYHDMRALTLVALSDRSIEQQLRRLYQAIPSPPAASFDLWLRVVERSRSSPLQLPVVAYLAYRSRHPVGRCSGVGKEPTAANNVGRVGCPDCGKRLRPSTTGKVRRHNALPSAPVDNSEPEPERTRRLDIG